MKFQSCLNNLDFQNEIDNIVCAKKNDCHYIYKQGEKKN